MSFLDLSELRRHYFGQAGALVTDFYIPVLREAVRYDRQAGYFDSGSLVQLAAGLAAFIHHTRNLSMTVNPPMRLVTGATWTPDDVAAYQRGSDALDESLNRSLLRHFEPSEEECLRLGLPPGWRPEEDQIARHRLGALAWMVAAGLLEVRIALPLDHGGRPYQPGRFGALYHPKAGILFDPEGNMLSFQGSVNETGPPGPGIGKSSRSSDPGTQRRTLKISESKSMSSKASGTDRMPASWCCRCPGQ